MSLPATVRAALLATLTALVMSVAVAPGVTAADADTSAASPRQAKDPRLTRALFVDRRMPAAQQGAPYARAIGSKPQALWFTNEHYPTGKVRGVARTYTRLAERARRTPMLVIYAIPARDCGQYSAGGFRTGKAYRAWIDQIALGIKGSKPLVIIEPDAIPFQGEQSCQGTGTERLDLIRYATRKLTSAGAWAYIDAGHSDWTPYDSRAALLKRAGIQYARGFSINVSNFRTAGSENAYAAALLRDLRGLGVKGKRYVIDTSRNGATNPVAGDVINPTWARIGRPPARVFKGNLDFTLWVKHPGESDGTVNGGPASGEWSDCLADRLLSPPNTYVC